MRAAEDLGREAVGGMVEVLGREAAGGTAEDLAGAVREAGETTIGVRLPDSVRQ
jgi:hypothetical protein